ncbi:hypothetical protein ACFL1H_07135 [Nanoarchaeota archaeon]
MRKKHHLPLLPYDYYKPEPDEIEPIQIRPKEIIRGKQAEHEYHKIIEEIKYDEILNIKEGLIREAKASNYEEVINLLKNLKNL